MAYTNEQTEQIFNFFHDEQGMEVYNAIAISLLVTGDAEMLENLTPSLTSDVNDSLIRLRDFLDILIELTNK